MADLMTVLVILLGGWIIAYLRLPAWSFFGGVTLILALWTYLAKPSMGVAITFWVLLALFVLLLCVPPIRRLVISNPILPLMRKALPPMSSTEQEALEAGSVWWDAELFSGKPDWKKLLSHPEPALSKEEQDFLDGPVEELCALLDDWEITENNHDLPPKAWQFIKSKGFLSMIIPKEYGGLDFSALAHSAVVMKIATRSVSSAVTVMVPNSLGPAKLLLHYGTDEQKNHYLPRLARGDDIPCFALTGPEAGSDAGAIPDLGIVCKDTFQGRTVLGIRLNWEKRYITLGPVATVLGLAFKLKDPDHLLGDQVDIGITLALIPTNTPGVEIGERHAPLSLAFQNGPNRGKDVFIPMEWVIGGQEQVGKGWRMLMECLADGRAISLPALSTGAGKLASQATGAYSRVRKQFQTPIGNFEGVSEALARIAGYTYILDAGRTLTATALDRGEKPSVISAIAKYHMTEHMRVIINDAMDIQGGSGICMGPRNYLARVYQAIPISITVEGANILTRNLIIFGQGAVRCHPFLYDEMKAAMDYDNKRASVNFDRALFGHIGFTLSNFVRTVSLNLGLTWLLPIQGNKSVRGYYQQLTRMSAAYAFVADIAMVLLGGQLKRKESLSARLGDILSGLYLASAVLKRFQDQRCPPSDLPLVHWCCQYLLSNIQVAFDELLRNFPNRPLAWMLRRIVFPFGRAYLPPRDQLSHQISALLLSPNESKQRLVSGMFSPESLDEPLGRLQDALTKAIAAEPIEKLVKQAVRANKLPKGANEETLLKAAVSRGVIDGQQADIVRAATKARLEVIQVDAFPQDYWHKEAK